MTSPDLTAANIGRLAELFPNVVTETLDDDGNQTKALDFDVLRQELSDHVVEGPQERYRLDWPGKRAAAFAANAPIAKTLRPKREESVDFDTTKNLFIEGDNLDALKLLQESYLGKVKLIYIDPPYNTGRDFIYDDDFAESTHEYLVRSGQTDGGGNRLVANFDSNGRFHSDWLSMMYPRLKLARNLLTDNGVIFISIDDNEVDNLREIASEIFGAQNFVAQIIWQKVFSPKNSAQWFSEDHDYILVFARNKEHWAPNPLPRTTEMDARYKNPDNDARGPWASSDLAARNRYDAGLYPIETPSGRIIDGPPKGSYWRFSKQRFNELVADGRIWWGASPDSVPRLKRYLSEVSDGRTPQTLWPYAEVGHTQDAKKTLLKYVKFEHTENVMNSVKPVQLIQRILQLATSANSEDIVMDFFGGSGTTPHAVLAQNAADGGNRRFIAVQIQEPLTTPEPSFDSILGMSLERLRNVAAELAVGTNSLDVGHRLVRVDSTNMMDVLRPPDATNQLALADLQKSVKPDRSGEDLLFQVLLHWGLELTMPIAVEPVYGQDVFVVEDGALIACFDAGLTPELVRTIAERKPLRAVFRDSGFNSDDARINAEQIFREVSPATDVKAI
ncbi:MULTISPECIES: site-specific DNA-methyltransferase [unclassified Rhodococcus (in: high G+C Gram-positive bacteria)]|uniref:site-specific DNA-methyltransferase n=1 Tax=unclassified Rhodococcus (in: high G+C Gram-positive bacteria) TaxID=192944 RepID=UPI001C9A7505|nr:MULTISPECIES: site-specific DNA-methyltransferase [unclassified Rhodococcus (in: high G+C Gram-positive bacteria)]